MDIIIIERITPLDVLSLLNVILWFLVKRVNQIHRACGAYL